MKKITVILVILMLLSPCSSFAAVNITINGNGLSFDVPPVNVEGRILVPLRAIFEALGANVEWNSETQQISAYKDSTTICLSIDNKVALINGQSITLDVAPKNINGRTMVPTRFIAESLGAEVGWDDFTNTVKITTKENTIRKTANGLIVEENMIEENDGIQTYRIKYMSDGLKVVGYIIRPVQTGEKLPILVFNRGGNREYEKIDQNKINYLKTFAQAGYIVLASQYRGNDGGEGKDEFGGKDVNDVINIIEAGKEIPDADQDNIVMYGASRGGFMTYQAIKQNVPIKAACVVSCGSDLFEAYEQGLIKNVLDELVGNPLSDNDKYIERSPYYWPDSINTPLLILHGEKDDRALVSDIAKFTQKLVQLGKEVKYRIFPDGIHGLNNLPKERDALILSWFNHYTKGTPLSDVYDGPDTLSKYLTEPYDIYGTYLIASEDLEKIKKSKNYLMADPDSMKVFGEFCQESKFSAENNGNLYTKTESLWYRYYHAMDFSYKRLFIVYLEGAKSINGCGEKIFKYNYAELVEKTKTEGEYYKVIHDSDMTVIVYGAKDLDTLRKLLIKHPLESCHSSMQCKQ